MDKERFDWLVNYSIHSISVDHDLTLEEYELGYHCCDAWDGLFINPYAREFECCACHPVAIRKNKIKEQFDEAQGRLEMEADKEHDRRKDLRYVDDPIEDYNDYRRELP